MELLRDHGNAVEADLQQHYGIELTDLWRGRLTLRRLRVLVDHLPSDSATARSIAGFRPSDALAGWGLTQLLIARLWDELAAYRWQWEAVHSKKGRPQRPAPEPLVPRLEEPPSSPSSRDGGSADVIPLVSPHRLGDFVDDDIGGGG